ncbi:MAG: primosomal protein N' [Luteitalea sp.]|nr:primosomal protein N' [Luteitalea sp.]
MRLVRVAVPVPGLDLLTYSVPPSVHVPPGARVIVPLGRRLLTGVVVDSPEPASTRAVPASVEIRPVVRVLDREAFLPPEVLRLALWAAEYYLAGPGEAVAAALPPRASARGEPHLSLTDLAETRCGDDDEVQAAVLRALAGGRPAPQRLVVARVRKALADGGDLWGETSGEGASRAQLPRAKIEHAISRLEKAGVLTRAHDVAPRASAFKIVKIATPTETTVNGVANARLGPKQREACRLLTGRPEGLPVASLAQQGVARETLRRLEQLGFMHFVERREERDPFSVDEEAASVSAAASTMAIELTDEQRMVLNHLDSQVSRGGFAVTLLHGVTGSGKTHVYVRLTDHARRRGRQVLILVPEIALTPAIALLFRRVFGDRVAVQHSGLSDGERHDQWHRIRRGEIDVVVGTRSAVFAPLTKLGLVIVDEEHDSSYKQEDSPRYHGRDVAIVRARDAGALVVLGSATPAMETFENARRGRYHLLTMSHRVLDRPLAAVRIVNMREEYAERGPDVVLSRALETALSERLARGEQGMILLNRRGYAPTVFCRQCGHALECPHCSVTLTLHVRVARARCHYCDHTMRVPKACPTCGGLLLEYAGIGTERVEQEIGTRFPGVRVARVDRDTMTRRGALVDVLRRFGRHELDVLVGTQMIAKGHDFPAVTLVGVISADVGLGLADFRAAERTFQLLTQVAGRAGRGDQAGEAIIQTLFPEHYSIELASRQDYLAFFEHEVAFRRKLCYPPHVALINVVVRAKSLGEALRDANDLIIGLGSDRRRFRVLGPAVAPLERLRGQHRVQFFLKGTERHAMRDAVRAALAARPDLGRRATVDVDPWSML